MWMAYFSFSFSLLRFSMLLAFHHKVDVSVQTQLLSCTYDSPPRSVMWHLVQRHMRAAERSILQEHFTAVSEHTANCNMCVRRGFSAVEKLPVCTNGWKTEKGNNKLQKTNKKKNAQRPRSPAQTPRLLVEKTQVLYGGESHVSVMTHVGSTALVIFKVFLVTIAVTSADWSPIEYIQRLK